MLRALWLSGLGAILTFAPSLWAQPEPVPPPEPPPAEPPPPPAEPPPAEPPPPPPAAEPAPAEPPPPAYPAAYPEPEPLPPPPPPAEAPDEGFKMPPFSVRIDPFNWLLEGRLGLELEVGLLKFMSVEIVPVFVANEKPPTLNLSGSPDTLRQESNGLGPISGASIDVGFWLEGEALHGYVIRLGITNYGYTYRTEDDLGEIDTVDTVEREVFFMFGSQSNWGAFTIAGGIGLGLHLNKDQRCFPDGATSVSQVTTENCDDELQIVTERDFSNVVDLHGGLFPADLFARFSLGVMFD
jgi:hypothetical protein